MSDGYIAGFLLHKGGAQFRYVQIELEENMTIYETNILESQSPAAQFEMTTADCGLVKIHIEGNVLQITQQAEMAKTFDLATLYSNQILKARNPLHGSGDPEATGRLAFDFNGDGAEDEMVCGYWERWNVLQGCSVHLQGKIIQVGAGSPSDLQCRSIVVSDVIQNGLHRLVYEYGGIRKNYFYDPSKEAYVETEGE